jgi:hypothetical protein
MLIVLYERGTHIEGKLETPNIQEVLAISNTWDRICALCA